MIRDYIKLPIDDDTSNKTTTGKILVVAGSANISGAAILCSLASLRSGTRYQYIYSHKNNEILLKSNLFESIVFTYDDNNYITDKLNVIDKVDAIIIGPGISTTNIAKNILEFLLINSKVPVIIDADGLNIISENIDFLNINKNVPLVLTPHAGEESRIIKNNNLEQIQDLFAINENIIVVSKNYFTKIISKDDEYTINKPCSALAKAGSGDVLTGIIGSLISQKLDPFTACITGVYMHNRTGRILYSEYGKESVLPRDIVNNLYRTILEIKDEKYDL